MHFRRRVVTYMRDDQRPRDVRHVPGPLSTDPEAPCGRTQSGELAGLRVHGTSFAADRRR